MAEQFSVIGKSIIPKETRIKATGACKYVDDLPTDLYVKILRSPHPHALIKSIDVSEAEKLPGVEAVITYKDVPNRLMPRGCARSLYILDRHLRHVGDEVAAVAAVSEAIAEEALDLIKVEYEVLPAVYDPEEAAKPDAPKLYPEGNVYGPQYDPGVERGVNEPTLLEWGDINKGFAEADVIVEDTFWVGPQVHSPVEPHVCIASWNGDELTVWTATQVPYEVREGLAYVFGLPEGKVRVISPYIGGGFGGKYLNRYHAICALLSKKAGGKRTKIRFTREEEQTHCKRFMCREYVKVGAKKDGTLTAIYFKGYADLGGYGNVFGFSAFWGEYPACSYKVPNCRFEGWDVHTNHFTSQPMRSVQLPATVFAVESVIDQLAEKLGMDPIELRLKNMPQTGDVMPPAPYIANTVGYPRAELEGYPSKKLLQAVAEKLEWKKRWKGWGQPVAVEGSKRRGIGIVYSGYEGGFCHDGFMSVSATLNKDGSVTVMSGTQDLGNASNLTLCQLAAEFMGIPLEEVNIVTGDTSIGQYDFFGARASRELTTGGHLLLQALEEIKQKVRAIAAPKLGVKPEEVEIKGKKAYVKTMPEDVAMREAIPLTEILTTSITASASGPPGSVFPEVAPGKKVRNAMAAGAEVEVDMETGEVKVLRLVTANCPGRAINPAIVRGQYQGAAAISLGYALWEDFVYDEARSVYLTDSYTDYRVPRASDVPRMENIIIEEPPDRPPHEGTPYGAQGVGELGCWLGPAVIASAIYNATGARVRSCPMTAEKILQAIREKEADR